MKKINKNKMNENSQNTFLKDNPNEFGVSESHRSYLGLKTPTDYFADSKNKILSSLSNIETKDHNKFKINRKTFWAVAASVTILLTVTLTFLYDNASIQNINILTENGISYENNDDNLLISSLFMEDSEMDQFIDDYFIEEVISETGVERYSDDVIINSLLVEDSLVDELIVDYFFTD